MLLDVVAVAAVALEGGERHAGHHAAVGHRLCNCSTKTAFSRRPRDRTSGKCRLTGHFHSLPCLLLTLLLQGICNLGW